MKPIIIAEIGINFHGNINLAKKLIRDSKDCYENIICKFQWYSAEDLFNDPKKDTYRPDIYQNVKSFMLNENEVFELKTYCEKHDVEFMCSVFDEERFNKLESMNVKRHKIASRVTKYDRDLAIRILETRKEAFVSTGFDAEPFDTKKYPNCRHMYCKAKYPSEHEDFDLPRDFNESMYYGFSSHAMDPYPAMVSLARGSKCVEVHFTTNKSMTVLPGGYDHLCSLDKAELQQLCDFAKNIKDIR